MSCLMKCYLPHLPHKLEELARVKVVSGEGRTLESYSYLINTRHRDDEDICYMK